MISGLRQAPCYDAAQFLSQLLLEREAYVGCTTEGMR